MSNHDKRIITRFAPSPTGDLHIGGARTALFNYLLAKKTGGKFILRIEDTDINRSSDKFNQSITRGLTWLGLEYGDNIFHQSDNFSRYRDVVNTLLDSGDAYLCYDDSSKVKDTVERGADKYKRDVYRSPWRDGVSSNDESSKKPVIRLKVPINGDDICFTDKVYGEMKMSCKDIEDIVLLRSDGSPTYMLAVIVDDYDMEISHVIRGSDHLSNTFKQLLLFRLLSWNPPVFVHIPLINNEEGEKLSKRRGALSVLEYKDMGIMSKAMRNYLLRLGWGSGDAEIISDEDALDLFSIDGLRKSPSCFDMKKLMNLNSHYIKVSDSDVLLAEIKSIIAIECDDISMYKKFIDLLKDRSDTLLELHSAIISIINYSDISRESLDFLKEHGNIINDLQSVLNNIESHDWNSTIINSIVKKYGKDNNVKLKNIYISLRSIVIGKTSSPSIVDIFEILGKDTVMKRFETYFVNYS